MNMGVNAMAVLWLHGVEVDDERPKRGSSDEDVLSICCDEIGEDQVEVGSISGSCEGEFDEIFGDDACGQKALGK
ncbi:hypothetical protein NDN08_007669 [Rhodosorus marinus]|uniref:Uncharacterized protein n=1 Tax=Rhodosorus marinus TaxID=101924 RepID=A0AAV8V111_9RHOD|nr:hypothetical protein NDN08_007669 [Rhodosorus marinus]